MQLFHGCFSHFSNCTNGIILRKASNLLFIHSFRSNLEFLWNVSIPNEFLRLLREIKNSDKEASYGKPWWCRNFGKFLTQNMSRSLFSQVHFFWFWTFLQACNFFLRPNRFWTFLQASNFSLRPNRFNCWSFNGKRPTFQVLVATWKPKSITTFINLKNHFVQDQRRNRD